MLVKEIAWASGLFEGEGCISMNGGTKPCPRITLAMSDRDVVRKFSLVFPGGTTRLVMPRPGNLQVQPLFCYRIFKRACVLAALETMIPFFGSRRKKVAIEAIVKIKSMGPAMNPSDSARVSALSRTRMANGTFA